LSELNFLKLICYSSLFNIYFIVLFFLLYRDFYTSISQALTQEVVMS